MFRPNLIPLLLALLVVAPVTAKSQESGVEYKIAETQPGLSAQLRPWGKLYVRLTYRTVRPVGFYIEGYAAGQKVRHTSSNIAPAYPAGEGEALVWMSYKDPTKIDEIRIMAIGDRWDQPLGSISAPVQLEWTPAAKSNPRAPSWFARLNREQQDRAAEAERQRPKNTALGGFIFTIIIYSTLAYPVLQLFLIFTVRGRWRIAALLPVIAMVPFGGMTANAIVHGSNLWPLVVMAFLSIAAVYLLLLLIVRWLVGRSGKAP
jgi:hypothetical protein